MNRSDKILERELVGAGANRDEIGGLLAVANRLQTLQPQAALKRRWYTQIRWLPISAAALGLFVAVVTVAQGSLPGAPLYSVKRATENTAVLLVPSYRVSLMMRRADEARLLIAQGAGQQTVAATLAAYQTEAAAYRGTNYPAFEHCKHSLHQAIAAATPREKVQIEQILKNLGDIR